MFDKIKDLSVLGVDGAKRARDVLGRTMSESADVFSATKEKSVQMLEKHWPVVEKLIVEGLIGISEEKLKDQMFLEATFGKVYEFLPIAVRVIMERDKFIGYCLRHQEPLVARLEVFKSERESGTD